MRFQRKQNNDSIKIAPYIFFMKNKFQFLSLLFCVFSTVLCAQSISSIYVNPLSGSDKNNGQSITSAFKTIAKAKEVVKAVNMKMTSDITVYLAGGVYYLNETLLFDEQDAGKNGFKVVYKNYPNEKPLISGGQLITNWKLFDKEKKIYRARIKGLTFRQLYVNGKWATRARTPNSGTLKIAKWDTGSKLIYVDKTAIKKWDNFSKVEMVENTSWSTHHILMKDFECDSVHAKIAVNQLNEVIFEIMDFFRGFDYFFENAYEFIDSEGEWYLNNTEEYVYYKPFADENMSVAEVVAPKLDPIVNIEGSGFGKTVTNLQFAGISFMHSTWLRPDTFGNIEMQAGQYFKSKLKEISNETAGRPSSAIIIKNANNVSIERCTFSNLGSTAIDIISGAKNILVSGNVIKDIAGNGIAIGLNTYGDLTDFSDTNLKFQEYICKNIRVQNNYITRIGRNYLGSVAIMYGYSQYTNIEHNEIENIPYTGISAGWGWTPKETPLKNNTIRYNHVHNYMNVLYDGGGIYVLSNQPNSVCSFNYIENMSVSVKGYGWNALYFDEGVRNFAITNNVCEIQQDDLIHWLGMQNVNTGAKDCKIDNNYTNSITLQDNNNHVSRIHYRCAGDEWPKEAREIIQNAGLEKEYKDIKN